MDEDSGGGSPGGLDDEEAPNRAGTPDRWDSVADSYGSSPNIARLAKALVDVVGISPGDAVIDIGTGTGLALVAAKSSGAGYTLGVDRSPRMLEVATHRMSEAGLAKAPVARADGARIPVRDASFDVALAGSVWQFLGYSTEALREWRRLLRPGGRLGLSLPGPGSNASLPADLSAKYFPRLAQSAQEDFLSRASGPAPDLIEAAALAGYAKATVVSRSWEDVLSGPEAWWAIQWTHAVRFFLQALDSEALAELKAEAVERLERVDAGAIRINTSCTYCVAES